MRDFTKKDRLIDIFQDTMGWCESDQELAEAVKNAKRNAVVYEEDKYPEMKGACPFHETEITVTHHRSFEAAMKLREEFGDAKIAVHNFASATNPGGGVTRGSTAQEECLCRCSTLYPVLSSRNLWSKYYGFHRSRHDSRYTDACIYSPGIRIIKTDENFPERMPKEDWITVDVITCAAPNLREKPGYAMEPDSGKRLILTADELLQIHMQRARHLLTIAAHHGAEVLVLGAFGCGAFQNDPKVVAAAYKAVLPEFNGRFKRIEFAVYTSRKDSTNYDAFEKALL